MQAQPAYTAVAARQTLPRPVPPPESLQPQNDFWTPDVRAYVRRAFDNTSDFTGINQSEMQEKLKAVITWAAEGQQIGKIDWNTYPLPQQLLLQDRERAALYGTSALNLTNHSGPAPSPMDGTFSPPPTSLGKRKSSEFDTANAEAQEMTPPWKKQATKTSLESRISGKPKSQDKKQKKAEAFRANMPDARSSDALERRRQRFGHVSPGSTSLPSSDGTPIENPRGPVVGTCQKIEKNYFRLTSAPKPEEVRPLPVLKEMMNVLRKKWKLEHNYHYACDQFKSLRQDLTVQHIQTEFTVTVYEAHARIALEMGDLGEYNQCQTQLRALYKMNLGGRQEEFKAYRILYFIYTCNRADMNSVLADLTEADKKMAGVKHALQVRAALATGNYHKFFKLYQDTPFMGAYLLDMCIPRERLAALASVCKTYKPDVPLSFLVNELAFQGDEEDPDFGSRACVQFICEHGGEDFITRDADGNIRFQTGKAMALFENAKLAAFRRVDIKGQI